MKSINAIGESIMRIRKKNKLTQAQFGELIGKSQSAVYSYENGSVIPSFKTLLLISQLFGVSMGQLMGLEWTPLSAEALREIYEIYIKEAKANE